VDQSTTLAAQEQGSCFGVVQTFLVCLLV